MKNLLTLKSAKNLLLSGIALFLTVSFSSCVKTNNTDVVDPSGKAYTNIINAAETSSPQDFYLDDSKQTPTPLSYTQSTGYITVTGTHVGSFRTASNGAITNSFPVALQTNHSYSLYLADDKQAIGIEDDKTAPQAGKARVRVVNLSAFLTTSVDVMLTGGSSLITGLAYETFSNYYDVSAGSALSVNTTGSATVLLNVPTTVIQAAHVYTIYISGASQATLSYHVITEI